MSEYLFVYGTLLPGVGADGVGELSARLRAVGLATVRGRLYDLGAYPGLVMNEAGDEVEGYVYEVPEDGSVLERLDEYEGCDAEEPGRGLFCRVRTAARLEDGGAVECWVYVYNCEVSGARWIESGRWG